MAAEHNGHLGTIVEVLEKVLDKGLVIAGDIKVQIADVELLTIKIRLLVASIDKAREIGMISGVSESFRENAPDASADISSACRTCVCPSCSNKPECRD